MLWLVQDACINAQGHTDDCAWGQQWGRIFNIASVAGVEPMAATPVYAASKWGLRGWSLSTYNVSSICWHPAP